MHKPDLTAPRYRFKIRYNLNRGLIARFKDKYPQYAHYDQDKLIGAMEALNKAFADSIVNTRDGVELPADLGYVFVGMYTSNKKLIARKQSSQLGVEVYHRNFHSNGMVAHIAYYALGKNYQFRRLWYFKGARPLTRAVSKAVAGMWTKYVRLEAHLRFNDLFDKRMFKHKSRLRTREGLKTYDDFQL